MWSNFKRTSVSVKSREAERVPEIKSMEREEHENLHSKINNLTINLREMTFLDQNVLSNAKHKPNKLSKGKQSFQNLSYRFSHLEQLNHDNIKLKEQVEELKKKVEDQKKEIARLSSCKENNSEKRLVTQDFSEEGIKALRFLVMKFRENFERIKKSAFTQKLKDSLQSYKNLVDALEGWSKEVCRTDNITKTTDAQTFATEEDQLLSFRKTDSVDFENIPIEKIKLLGHLGVGANSSVHKALYCGEEVAVKKIFRGGDHGKELEKVFWKEVNIMKKIRHPKIILFMGTAQTEDHYYIITEYMSRRSLDLVLKDTNITLDLKTKLKIAIDIAKGLSFLHSLNPPILHRDLKAANCLCNEHFEVKLADFGLAKFKDQNFNTNSIATVRYMAPEFITKQTFAMKSDIFSFGMVLWEIFSRKEPFDHLNPTQALYAIAVNQRPDLPQNMPDGIKDLVRQCWDQDSNVRPDSMQILKRLSDFEAILE